MALHPRLPTIDSVRLANWDQKAKNLSFLDSGKGFLLRVWIGTIHPKMDEHLDEHGFKLECKWRNIEMETDEHGICMIVFCIYTSRKSSHDIVVKL